MNPYSSNPRPSVIEETLNRIIHATSQILDLSSSSCARSPSTISSPSDPPASCSLPNPSSIYPKLISTGISTSVAAAVSRAYLENAAQLQQSTERAVRKVYADIAKLPTNSNLTPAVEVYRRTLRTYRHKYLQTLEDWSNKAVERARSHRATQREPLVPVRTQFNQDYTPFLTFCFERNAYPSQADRALFARKSMMTPRQIEVWFQNHRRRARKEGRPVVRRRPDDHSPIDLEELAKLMPDLFVSESQRSNITESDWDEVDEEMEDLSDDEDVPDQTERHASKFDAPDILDVQAPQHAFPTVFSECRNYRPFPTTDDGFTFPPPVWMRKPATQRVNRSSPDFEDLTARFERLSLLTPLMTGSRKTGSGKHSRPISIEPSPPKRKYPLPTTFTPVTPPSGRHPAFVPTPSESRVSLSTSKPTMPIVRAPDSRLHAFQTPAPESPPVSLMPSSTSSSSVPVYKKTLPRRQVARLPRRTPQSQSVAHRTSPIHPVTTPSSPSSSPSVSSGSRTSSFESLFSSHTRTSSSGSDTSLPNMPITPTFSPTPLQPPAPVTATDFSFTDDLFGDSLFDLSFPPNAFQLNGFGNASKPIQTPSYNDFNFNFTPSQFLQA